MKLAEFIQSLEVTRKTSRLELEQFGFDRNFIQQSSPLLPRWFLTTITVGRHIFVSACGSPYVPSFPSIHPHLLGWWPSGDMRGRGGSCAFWVLQVPRNSIPRTFRHVSEILCVGHFVQAYVVVLSSRLSSHHTNRWNQNKEQDHYYLLSAHFQPLPSRVPWGENDFQRLPPMCGDQARLRWGNTVLSMPTPRSNVPTPAPRRNDTTERSSRHRPCRRISR